MCGIAGFGSSRNKVEARWIHGMTAELAHRGPDDEGYLAIDAQLRNAIPLTGVDSKVDGQAVEDYREPVDFFLGHRRLSILDPTPLGHQPMCSKDGNLWIVFNGEIYNYIELRAELKEKGYTFNTTSDTEVLLAAYEKWGEKCLERLDGMWTFVIYDRRRGRLFGARDRFGVKPFYYYNNDGYFAFASEIKALLTLPVVPRELNNNAVFDFLVFSGLPFVEESFFKGIDELQPAHAFSYVIKNGRFKKWQYFTLNYTGRNEAFNEKKSRQYIRDLRELIVRSVKLRLRSDVPVGSALSGGIDSSAIVCIISQLMNIDNIQGMPKSLLANGYRQRVFTASFPDSPIDESQWAKMAAEKSHARWYRTFPKAPEFLEDMEDLAYTQDIPYGSPSVYAQYRVMKLARENGVKVLLDGQGADELFTGYTMYYEVFFYQLLKQFNLGRFFHELGRLDNAPLDKQELLTALFKQIRRRMLPYSLVRKHRMDQNRHPHYRYITADFWDAHKERFDLIKARDFTSLNTMLAEYFTRQKLSNLLKYEDRNSMRFSIEARTPFADHLDLIRYVFNIPAVYKIHNGWSKYLLREAMKGILPDEIRLRKDKKGFFIPDIQWLDALKKDLNDYLSPDLKEFINIPMLQHHLEQGLKDANYEFIRTIWNIISFAVWKKVYNI
jgi:asparagine synthase (glutamine-hydrolysing)